MQAWYTTFEMQTAHKNLIGSSKIQMFTWHGGVWTQHTILAVMYALLYIHLPLSSSLLFFFPVLSLLPSFDSFLNFFFVLSCTFTLSFLPSLHLSRPKYYTVHNCFITYWHLSSPRAARSLFCTSLYLFLYFTHLSTYTYTLTKSLTQILIVAVWIHCSGKLLYLPTPSNLMLIHHLTPLSTSLPAAHPFPPNSSSWIIAARKKFSMHTWWALWSISLSESLSVLLNPTLSNWRV